MFGYEHALQRMYLGEGYCNNNCSFEYCNCVCISYFNGFFVVLSFTGYTIFLDVDECTEGTDDCVDGATCMNTDGSFTCTCPHGYSGDGRANRNGCLGMRLKLFLI